MNYMCGNELNQCNPDCGTWESNFLDVKSSQEIKSSTTGPTGNVKSKAPEIFHFGRYEKINNYASQSLP